MTKREVLQAFVKGQLTFDALRQRLKDVVDFRWGPGQGFEARVTGTLPSVVLTIEDVTAMLAAFERAEVSAQTLAQWGTVLIALDAFETSLVEEVDEVVWESIGEAALASVNPAFDLLRARKLLNRLSLL